MSKELEIKQFVNEIKLQALTQGWRQPVRRLFGKWAIILNYGTKEDMEKINERLPLDVRSRDPQKPRWVFTMRLVEPKATKEDWQEAPMFAAAMGAPKDPVVPFSQLESCDAIVWTWVA